MQLLAKNLSGEEIARELITTLSTELGITPTRLLETELLATMSQCVGLK
jgi:hypothetical protein